MRSRGAGDLIVAYLLLSDMMSVVPVAQEGCSALETSSSSGGFAEEKITEGQVVNDVRFLLFCV